MKITKLTQQVKRKSRYSIFVDDVYSFGLSENALLDSGIVDGQEVDEAQLGEYKLLSDNDKLYGLALRYAAMRPRSTWEMQFYMKHKDFPVPLLEQITNKLIRIGMLDDAKFAEMFVHDRRLLCSTSKRKIQLELQKKHIASDIIQQALGEDETDEPAMLKGIITRKRQQSKFRDDDLKLMQYLARQGFGYGDIKHALEELAEEA